MKKIFLIFFVVLSVLGNSLYAQDRQVTGTVTDFMDGSSLPGVSVAVKGTTIGAVTDAGGRYSLTVPQGAVLVFSFVGMNTEEVAVGDRNIIDMAMTADIGMLQEIVVVGYGTMRRSDITTSSVSVRGDQLTGTVSANLDQALQGRAAGLTAITTSGQPGSSVSIRIRGQGTLNANAAEPLYVIDGVPVQNVSQSGGAVGLGDRLGNSPVSTFSGGLSNINPADILSVEVLKDAAATAIFGSRGANGVILITTRRGRAGEATFNYSFNHGIQEQAKRIDMLNLREFAEYSNSIAAEIAGRDPRVEFADPSLLGTGTDWQDAIFRVAPMQNHQISASGGTDGVRYFISGSYFNQEGIVVGSSFERFTGRVNLDADLKSWWKLGTNINLSRSDDVLGLNNSEEGIINIGLRSAPDVPIYNTDGSWSGDEREGSGGSVNPIAMALNDDILLDRTGLQASLFSDITFTEGLTLRSEVATDMGNTNARTFRPTFRHGNVQRTLNEGSWQFNQNTFWELRNYLTYNTSLARHNATAMLGQEVSEWRYEFLSGQSSGLPSDEIRSPILGEATSHRIGSGFGSGAMASFFTRITYNFDERYYATYTFRYDGSSNFGPENRWAPFHSTSVMWRVSNENFWEGLAPIVNNFRIRGSWGQTGNANIGSYLWGASISRMPTGLGMGYRQSNIANPYIQWEKQEQYNVGVDLSFFQNRIDLMVDLYLKRSTDMLMSMQLPSYMGTRGNPSARLNPPMGNFGEIENRGLEISLNAHPIARQLEWSTSLSFSLNRNKLLGLTGSPAAFIEGYGQWTDLVSLSTIGEPLFNFYGYVVDGVYTSRQDILDSPRTEAFPADGVTFERDRTVWVGDLKFKDLSGPEGLPDGIIDTHDRTNLGSPFPKFTFGFSNTFRYRAWELTVFMNGWYGNKIMNYMGRSLNRMNALFTNQLDIANDRTLLGPIDNSIVYYDVDGNVVEGWFYDIDNVQIVRMGKDGLPRAIVGDPNNNSRISDRYIEDGSFLRIRNINLTYNVPARFTQRFGLNNVSIFTNLQNLHTFTRYSGFDPEIGASQTSANVYGLDNGRYPSPRIYTFGVNVTF